MKVLLAGESWMKHTIHVKGFDSFTTSEYEEGISWFKAAMESGGIDFEFMPSHEATENFPLTLEGLQKYDVVILSDIGSNSLLLTNKTFVKSDVTLNRLSLIEEYVKLGGGFAMIGGYMSFQGIDGKAKYKDTPIEEILPVTMFHHDDRQESPEGITIKISSSDHPVLDGINASWPHFLGYNKLIPKPTATVVANHNEYAFIATQEHGKGRTLSFASDCAPHWGPKEFVNWKYYDKFWLNVVKWLSGKKS